MSAEERQTCAHPICNCPRPDGANYCSSYCQAGGAVEEIACNCGHADCAAQTQMAIGD
jgi:hypothetical protein